MTSPRPSAPYPPLPNVPHGSIPSTPSHRPAPTGLAPAHPQSPESRSPSSPTRPASVRSHGSRGSRRPSSSLAGNLPMDAASIVPPPLIFPEPPSVSQRSQHHTAMSPAPQSPSNSVVPVIVAQNTRSPPPLSPLPSLSLPHLDHRRSPYPGSPGPVPSPHAAFPGPVTSPVSSRHGVPYPTAMSPSPRNGEVSYGHGSGSAYDANMGGFWARPSAPDVAYYVPPGESLTVVQVPVLVRPAQPVPLSTMRAHASRPQGYGTNGPDANRR